MSVIKLMSRIVAPSHILDAEELSGDQAALLHGKLKKEYLEMISLFVHTESLNSSLDWLVKTQNQTTHSVSRPIL